MKKVYVERLHLYGKPSVVPRKPLKSLTGLFLSIHVFFGIDSGFANLFQGKVQYFLEIYSTSFFIILMAIMSLSITILYKVMWYWINFVGFILYFIILKKTRYSIFSLLTDFHNLEYVVINNGIIGVITSIYIYIMFALKLGVVLFSCFLDTSSVCVNFPPGSYAYSVASNIIDCYPVPTFVISYYIYIVVKQMKSVLERDTDIENFIRLYKTVADSCDKIRPLYNNLVSMLLSL